MTMTTAIVPGSLQALAQTQNKSIAETFISAACIVIVDTSGSMTSRDSRGGLSRYDVACQELAQLQATQPGKIAVIAFSDQTVFCPGGQPMLLGGSTDLAGALRFTKVADVQGMRFVVISDGEPNSESAALNIAAAYRNRIDTIYVGPEWENAGREFLRLLAQASRGQAVTADRAKELAPTIEKLLLSAGA